MQNKKTLAPTNVFFRKVGDINMSIMLKNGTRIHISTTLIVLLYLILSK